MVQIMLEGLRADPRFEVHHVDARVSDDLEDAEVVSSAEVPQTVQAYPPGLVDTAAPWTDGLLLNGSAAGEVCQSR